MSKPMVEAGYKVGDTIPEDRLPNLHDQCPAGKLQSPIPCTLCRRGFSNHLESCPVQWHALSTSLKILGNVASFCQKRAKFDYIPIAAAYP
ncbi:MAG TPA: hypothetical protein VGJ68_00685, partial [Bradyrhizobium sp.]